jgi:hypothetical protein
MLPGETRRGRVNRGKKLVQQLNAFRPRNTERNAHTRKVPLGRLKLSTRPTLTGSAPVTKTKGIVLVAAFAANTLGYRLRKSQ